MEIEYRKDAVDEPSYGFWHCPDCHREFYGAALPCIQRSATDLGMLELHSSLGRRR